MSAPPGALLVAPPGPGRRSVARSLKRLGFTVRMAAEPFEATARFVEEPVDLVVLSLLGFRSRDAAFLRTVRRRAPACRILLLVPEGGRSLAREALAEGADAWIPEPAYREELDRIVRTLLPGPADGLDLSGEAGRAVRLLAQEIAHAVRNPLQVLRLLGEEGLPPKTAETLVSQVERVRDAVRILEEFTKLGKPAHVEGPLGTCLGDALEAAGQLGTITVASPPQGSGPILAFDPTQMRYAIDCTIETLAALAGDEPASLKAAVHRLTWAQGRALGPEHRRAVRAGRWTEVAFRAKGVVLDPDTFERLRGQVIWNHDDTRRAHPGLAPVDLVARSHAGRLLLRPSPAGSVLGIALPLP